MSIAENLLTLAEAEIRKQNCDRIEKIKIECGVLSGVTPDALTLCFQALVATTPHRDALLEIEVAPALLRCPFCQTRFTGASREALFAPCPACGEAFGHIVEAGRELILARIEAVNSAAPRDL